VNDRIPVSCVVPDLESRRLPHRYDPVGQCIYCGATDNLSDEHIMPLAIGGHWILPKASCRNCARITSKFEQSFCRTTYGPLRIQLDLPTRRKKERPQTLPVYDFSAGRKGEAIELPIDEHPTAVAFFKFAMPRIMRGLDDDGSHGIEGIYLVRPDSSVFRALNEKYDMDDLRPTARIQPISFARTVAKIAHSFSVAEIGLGKFKPYLLDLILGRSESIGYLIGGDDREFPRTVALHEIRIGIKTVHHKKLAAVAIRLFGEIGAPLYWAVSGEFIGEPESR
jgi:hypothetical protein